MARQDNRLLRFELRSMEGKIFVQQSTNKVFSYDIGLANSPAQLIESL